MSSEAVLVSLKELIMIMFWATQRHENSELADLAKDLIACPASQAYVSFLFAVCFLLDVAIA